MNLAQVESAFRTRTGLDPGALGASAFPRAVEVRMRERNVVAPEAYLGLLTSDPDEPDALAAEVVVHETWFFRGGRALFDRLAQFASTRTDGNRIPSQVRILSFPCSTGEEPYSLAIALQEHLVPRGQYHIDAIDLSPRHLASAAEGRFATFSFREAGADIRPTYFRQHEDRWEIAPYIRTAVHFRQGNVVHAAFLLEERPYDLILCRNLFIYLTPEGRRQAMEALDRLLAVDGWLCVTPAEADRLPPDRFVHEGPPEFGIYRRSDSASGVRRAAKLTRPVPAALPAPRATMNPAPVAAPVPPIPPREVAPLPPGSVTAARVRELADSGRLADALAASARLLSDHPASAEVYTVIGVIHLAGGETDRAVEAFRKALYLEPDEPEALSHMIVICDGRGDAAQAGALRRRLARATAGGAA